MRDEYSRRYIDDNGNVTAFNMERFDKLHMGYRKFRNPPNGLGIFNFIKSRIAATDRNWHVMLKVFHIILSGSAWMRKDGFRSRLYKRLMMLAPDKKRNSASVVLPLDVDISEAAEKVVVPIDLIKETLAGADYIAAMNSCICREAEDCKDYPHDLACLFIGRIGNHIVENGIGRRVTYEEACAIVDRAAECGLVGQSVWVEMEQLIWGIRNDELDSSLEICFCCPCCCATMTLARNASREIRDRFHPSGWTAVPVRSKCTGCGECLSVRCPQGALSIGETGVLEIDQNYCVGCGICKTRCANGAIKIRQTMPVRDGIIDYFREEFSLDLKVFD